MIVLTTTPFAGMIRIRFEGLRPIPHSQRRGAPLSYGYVSARVLLDVAPRFTHSMNREFVAWMRENASFLGFSSGGASPERATVGVAGEVVGEVAQLVADEVAGGDLVDGQSQ